MQLSQNRDFIQLARYSEGGGVGVAVPVRRGLESLMIVVFGHTQLLGGWWLGVGGWVGVGVGVGVGGWLGVSGGGVVTVVGVVVVVAVGEFG